MWCSYFIIFSYNCDCQSFTSKSLKLWQSSCISAWAVVVLQTLVLFYPILTNFPLRLVFPPTFSQRPYETLEKGVNSFLGAVVLATVFKDKRQTCHEPKSEDRESLFRPLETAIFINPSRMLSPLQNINGHTSPSVRDDHSHSACSSRWTATGVFAPQPWPACLRRRVSLVGLLLLLSCVNPPSVFPATLHTTNLGAEGYFLHGQLDRYLILLTVKTE